MSLRDGLIGDAPSSGAGQAGQQQVRAWAVAETVDRQRRHPSEYVVTDVVPATHTSATRIAGRVQ